VVILRLLMQKIIRKYIKGQHSALHCKTDIVGQCPEKFKCRTPKSLIIQLERAIAAQAFDVISEAWERWKYGENGTK